MILIQDESVTQHLHNIPKCYYFSYINLINQKAMFKKNNYKNKNTTTLNSPII